MAPGVFGSGDASLTNGEKRTSHVTSLTTPDPQQSWESLQIGCFLRAPALEHTQCLLDCVLFYVSGYGPQSRHKLPRLATDELGWFFPLAGY